MPYKQHPLSGLEALATAPRLWPIVDQHGCRWAPMHEESQVPVLITRVDPPGSAQVAPRCCKSELWKKHLDCPASRCAPRSPSRKPACTSPPPPHLTARGTAPSARLLRNTALNNAPVVDPDWDEDARSPARDANPCRQPPYPPRCERKGLTQASNLHL